jgi:hypothetical protein
LEAVIKCVFFIPAPHKDRIPMKYFLFVAAFTPYSIRNRLTALKKDRGDYIKPADVNSLYQAMIKQGITADHYRSLSGFVGLTEPFAFAFDWDRTVTRLNEVRDEQQTYNNRLDTTMADVFNLLSLFFMTIGKTNECPAIYSQIASLRVSWHAVRRIPCIKDRS